jgi:hypothetical protein
MGRKEFGEVNCLFMETFSTEVNMSSLDVHWPDLTWQLPFPINLQYLCRGWCSKRHFQYILFCPKICYCFINIFSLVLHSISINMQNLTRTVKLYSSGNSSDIKTSFHSCVCIVQCSDALSSRETFYGNFNCINIVALCVKIFRPYFHLLWRHNVSYLNIASCCMPYHHKIYTHTSWCETVY